MPHLIILFCPRMKFSLKTSFGMPQSTFWKQSTTDASKSKIQNSIKNGFDKVNILSNKSSDTFFKAYIYSSLICFLKRIFANFFTSNTFLKRIFANFFTSNTFLKRIFLFHSTIFFTVSLKIILNFFSDIHPSTTNSPYNSFSIASL